MGPCHVYTIGSEGRDTTTRGAEDDRVGGKARRDV